MLCLQMEAFANTHRQHNRALLLVKLRFLGQPTWKNSDQPTNRHWALTFVPCIKRRWQSVEADWLSLSEKDQ